MIEHINRLADEMRQVLGDSLTGRTGTEVRPRATIFDIDDQRLLIEREPGSGIEADLIQP